jgi:hypothetical protein
MKCLATRPSRAFNIAEARHAIPRPYFIPFLTWVARELISAQFGGSSSARQVK